MCVCFICDIIFHLNFIQMLCARVCVCVMHSLKTRMRIRALFAFNVS